MLLGILQAGDKHPDADPALPDYEAMFTTLFAAAAPHVSLRFFRIMDNVFPDHHASCDAWLITGSPAGVYDDLPWISRLMEFIRQAHAASVPLIGICFGHQAIAHALGGNAVKSDRGWGVGIRKMPVSEALCGQDWAADLGNGFALFYMHQDQVVALPQGATRLAGDAFCPNAAFSIGKTVLCLQGHPEFTPEFSAYLLQLRRQRIGTDLVDSALASLHGDQDGLSWAQAIIRFLDNAIAGPASASRQRA